MIMHSLSIEYCITIYDGTHINGNTYLSNATTFGIFPYVLYFPVYHTHHTRDRPKKSSLMKICFSCLCYMITDKSMRLFDSESNKMSRKSQCASHQKCIIAECAMSKQMQQVRCISLNIKQYCCCWSVHYRGNL